MLATGTAAQDPFVGRAVELRRLRAWRTSGGRLLTLRGPAGIGKSRLAWEFAREWTGHALVCELSDAADPDALVRRLARLLDVQATRLPDSEVEAALLDALRRQEPSLLVLDNLEPMGPTLGVLVARWLEAAPQLAFLATAGEALRVEGEQVLELAPLSVADEAVELLRLRAAAAGADLRDADAATIRAIAVSLDGLPLALELAAAQLPHLPAERLLEQLPARLELLVRTPGATHFSRHHTLREAIEASWRFLSPAQRSALAQLSVFRGGFESEAAAAVVVLDGADPLETVRSLYERSLLHLRQLGGGQPRYGLDESVRTFAARQLDPAERSAVERRHAAWYLARAEAWARALTEFADLQAGAALERAQENLLEIHRRAVGRSAAPTEAAADALRAAVLLAPLFLLRHHASALVALLDGALAAASPSRTDPALRAAALLARGKARLHGGRPASAHADLVEAAGLARGVRDATLEARALLELGRLHREQGRDDESRRVTDRAIELLREAGNDAWLGRALGSRGHVAHARGELEEALGWYEQAEAAHLRCGDRHGGAVMRGTMGNVLFDQGRSDEALEALGTALETFHAIGDDHNEAALLDSMGAIRQEAGDFDRSCAEYGRALALVRRTGSQHLAGLILAGLGGAHLEAGRLEEARQRLEEGASTFRALGDARNLALTLLPLGLLRASDGELAEAEAQIDRAEQLLKEVDDPVHLAAVAAARGTVSANRAAELRGAPERAGGYLEEALRLQATAKAGGAGAFEEGRLLLRLLERAIAAGSTP
ncbi:ATP-binding protein [Vulgatibacter sp.]|uniref:ATP-binding protein n=1 Tax=Vulgatibacter sp. TaxID=1971226 RepID=UPI003561D93C